MNKLDTKLQNTSFAIATTSDSTVRFSMNLESARRLIVLIPADSDYSAAPRRIWELANATGASVQFLGLCKEVAEEPSLRRGLITMSALVRDARVDTEIRVELGTNWVRAIKSDYHDGDMIVCFAEQRAGLLHKPLSQILESSLGGPIYILSGGYMKEHSSSNWVSQVIAWLSSIGIIVGAFFLQIRIASLPQDWAQTTLLILSVIGEVWLIWGWNSLFS
jgi:hypothetical protein